MLWGLILLSAAVVASPAGTPPCHKTLPKGDSYYGSCPKDSSYYCCDSVSDNNDGWVDLSRCPAVNKPGKCGTEDLKDKNIVCCVGEERWLCMSVEGPAFVLKTSNSQHHLEKPVQKDRKTDQPSRAEEPTDQIAKYITTKTEELAQLPAMPSRRLRKPHRNADRPKRSVE